jgi:hypothetical protein
MYTRKLVSAAVLFITGAMISLSACRKEKDGANSDEGGYASDQAKMEQTFNEIEDISDEAVTTGSLSNFKMTAPIALGPCATVSFDTLNTPDTVIIDFGPVNCLCADGRNRRGKIIVSYTGHYRDSGSVRIVTFNNYFVNDNQVLGSKTVTNMGHNSNGNTFFNISVTGSIVFANNQGTRSWTSTRTRTWIAGENTQPRLDDAYEITGSGMVVRANGDTVQISIVTPLLKAVACHWIKQGTVQISPSNKPVRLLNYGNGNCDNQATLTVNNVVHNITLP